MTNGQGAKSQSKPKDQTPNPERGVLGLRDLCALIWIWSLGLDWDLAPWPLVIPKLRPLYPNNLFASPLHDLETSVYSRVPLEGHKALRWWKEEKRN